jgi:hypothetical protein
MANTSNCLQLIDRMPQQDQDALLARLDALQAQGMTAKEAQLQAAIDVLAQVEREGQIRKSADRVTDTPAFKRWFGDSKVVNADGKPLVVYHGTTGERTVFEPYWKQLERDASPAELRSGSVAEIYKSAKAEPEMHFFAEDRGHAESYGPDVVETYLKIENMVGGPDMDRDEAIKLMLETDADGAQFYDSDASGGYGGTAYVVRRSTQIKSATGNNGEFSPTNPDIRKSPERDANFKRWSGGAPVIELGDYHEFRSGEPVVVEALHGTTNADLTEFKRSRANIESDMGAGFYASNTPEDVAANYANVDGPDLTQRVEMLAERLAQSDEFEDDMDAAREEARKRLSEGAPNTLKLFMRFKNPAVLGGAGETFFDLNEEYDEKNDSYGEATGLLLDFVEAIRNRAGEFDIEGDISDFIDGLMSNFEGVSFGDVIWQTKNTPIYAYNDNGDSAGNELIRLALQDVGFDGVIDTTVNSKFGRSPNRVGMKGMNDGTVHFIAFEPEQIKSATGNNGEFGENREILKSAERMARTPEFKKWFGDSKVVDADGNPLVVYHGTISDDFESFRPSSEGTFGAGIYFGDTEDANHYANTQSVFDDGETLPGRVIPAYLALENPLVVDVDAERGIGQSFLDAFPRPGAAAMFDPDEDFDGEITAQIKNMGFDGIVVNYVDGGHEYVAFNANQIKSIFNKAPTSSPDILKSPERPAFYSQLQRAIEGVPERIAKMAAPQWKLWLDSNGPKQGVKKDEIEWSGIKDYLDLQGKAKLSKDDLARYLDDSGVKVGEALLMPEEHGMAVDDWLESWAEENPGETADAILDGEPWDTTREIAEKNGDTEVLDRINRKIMPSKYDQYTLPGGKNYRELLITLPGAANGKKLAELDERIQELEDDRDGADYDERDAIDQRIYAVQAERKALLGNGYRSSHWNEPNVLAHIRVNDRTVQEIGYVARNFRSGFVSQVFATPEEAIAFQATLPESVKTEIVEHPRFVRVLFVEEVQSDAGQDKRKGKTNWEAPFIDKTEGWLNLALKRIAMMAVEGGYDKVAFVNGEQSADRYDLSKKISRIKVTKFPSQGSLPEAIGVEAWGNDRKSVFSENIYDASKLDDYIGKEIADRVREKMKAGQDVVEMKGLDLKVGGEGMKTFYDQIVPQALNKLLPKLGGEKLGAVAFGGDDVGGRYVVFDEDSGERLFRTNNRKEANEYRLAYAGDAVIKEVEASAGVGLIGEQPGFDVTEKMRETVSAGVPLFSRDRKQTETPAFKAWFGDSKVVDADGNPLVVYTGTSKDVDFKSFKIPKNGAWFTTDKYTASAYALENDSMAIKTENYRDFTHVNTASRVIPAYLHIEKMYTPTDDEMTALIRASNYKKEQGNLFDRVRRAGFDGVDMGNGVYVVIGDATQIKSAIGNNGSFDPVNKDITKSADRSQTATPAFKRWFGDSKVVDAAGEPLVVYHGSSEKGIAVFESEDGRFYFTDSKSVADKYGRKRGARKNAETYAVYLSMQNPEVFDMQGESWYDQDVGADVYNYIMDAMEDGRDGVILENFVDGATKSSAEPSTIYVVFKPEQIKSATDNEGTFDPANPDIRKSPARPYFDDLAKLKVSTNYQLGDLFKTSRKLSWWDRTIGTQYNLAQKHPQFKRVFDAVQQFINDVSAFATRAADLAPSILPKLETWKDIGRSPLSAADVKALRDPVFGGTLKYTRDENGELIETDDVQKAGVVFTDDELRTNFGLSDRQIGLYREFRKAVDQSVTDLAISDMIRYLGDDGVGIKEAVMASGNVDVAQGIIASHLEQIAYDEPRRADAMRNTMDAIKEKADQANRLMDRGYAPLSRFGQYTVYAVAPDGEQLYFSMFENERDANKMKREMEEQYPDATVSTGTMSQESYKLFSGVTPETLALFGDALGLEDSGIDTKSEAYQTMLKVAKTNRSAMKRMIERKGIEGFSEDAGRVLAGFVYSNARQIATNLHAGEIGKSASEVKDGDLKDAAINLMQYIQNPQEEAQALRGLMFTQFIGGSIASAMVNLTQPFTMTLPYLSQFAGMTGAGKAMSDAVKLASRGIRNDDELKAALKRAEEEGVVSPQEVHQLMAQAQGKGALQSGDGTKVGDALAKANNFKAKLSLGWGKLFGAAEQFNRRVTFIAAYKLAREKGMENPFQFAEQAIAETQGVYNKGNKPTWARGAVGGTLFTFKQYSIGYLEFLRRMWGNGPEGKKAVGLALAVLFLMSGVGGLPGADDLDDVIDGFAQRVLGRSFDSKQAKKEFFASILGQSGAEFVMSGISGLPGMPIDVSGRMGLGNFVPGTGFLTKKRDYGQDYKEIAGPAGTLFTNAGTALASMAQGDVAGAGKALSPVAVQNWLKAADMASMGFYRDQKGRKVVDTDGYDVFAKALGFQPRSVAQVQEATSTQANLIAQNKLRETEIADKWAQGRIERDAGKIEDAKKMLADWNAKNPSSPIKIDAAQINKRVIEANKSKAQRVAATAPKEIRGAVKKELQPAE